MSEIINRIKFEARKPFKYADMTKRYIVKQVLREQPILLSDIKLLNGLWYHDFSKFGFKTYQRYGAYELNQKSKQDILFSYIYKALVLCRNIEKIEKLKGMNEEIKGLELFCDDGFYSNYAVKIGDGLRRGTYIKMHGVDLDEKELKNAILITKLLRNDKNITFEKKNVFDITGTYDFCICAGGLYHISNPEQLLIKLRDHVKTALVIQTVYDKSHEEQDYFITPAPGWTWGCRFSHAYLINMIQNAGFKILQQTTNHLKGNERQQDRGSAYVLCVPE